MESDPGISAAIVNPDRLARAQELRESLEPLWQELQRIYEERDVRGFNTLLVSCHYLFDEIYKLMNEQAGIEEPGLRFNVSDN